MKMAIMTLTSPQTSLLFLIEPLPWLPWLQSIKLNPAKMPSWPKVRSVNLPIVKSQRAMNKNVQI